MAKLTDLPSETELALLRHIQRNPGCYGSTAFTVSGMKKGSVYTLLGRLKDAGTISKERKFVTETGRRHNLYYLTQKGKETLELVEIVEEFQFSQ